MPIPVLIPAHNEARTITRTIDSLARQSLAVDPFVIVNGCTDNTPDLARAAGANVLESEHGKMRAIQEGIRFLGKSAMNPFIVLDADTRPFTKRWGARLMQEANLGTERQPRVVWGPIAYIDDLNKIVGICISAYTSYVSWADRHDEDPRTIRGGNMGLRLATSEILEATLALKNYWPREDVAIYDTIMQHEGGSKVIFHPDAWANTSGDKYSLLTSIKQRLMEIRNANQLADEEYASRVPVDAEPYNSPHTRHPNKNPELASTARR